MLLRRCVGTGSCEDRRQILDEAAHVAAHASATGLQLCRDDIELALEQAPDV